MWNILSRKKIHPFGFHFSALRLEISLKNFNAQFVYVCERVRVFGWVCICEKDRLSLKKKEVNRVFKIPCVPTFQAFLNNFHFATSCHSPLHHLRILPLKTKRHNYTTKPFFRFSFFKKVQIVRAARQQPQQQQAKDVHMFGCLLFAAFKHWFFQQMEICVHRRMKDDLIFVHESIGAFNWIVVSFVFFIFCHILCVRAMSAPKKALIFRRLLLLVLMLLWLFVVGTAVASAVCCRRRVCV